MVLKSTFARREARARRSNYFNPQKRVRFWKAPHYARRCCIGLEGCLRWHLQLPVYKFYLYVVATRKFLLRVPTYSTSAFAFIRQFFFAMQRRSCIYDGCILRCAAVRLTPQNRLVSCPLPLSSKYLTSLPKNFHGCAVKPKDKRQLKTWVITESTTRMYLHSISATGEMNGRTSLTSMKFSPKIRG